jgi:hypothetical protein
MTDVERLRRRAAGLLSRLQQLLVMQLHTKEEDKENE